MDVINHLHPIKQWHKVMKARDMNGIKELLHEDAVFHSPVVWTPQRGKQLTFMYLMGASVVLGNNSFEYVREIIGKNDAMLEFACEVDGITVEGADIIHWNEDGKITDFKVMVRPLQAIKVVHQKMGEMLAKMK